MSRADYEVLRVRLDRAIETLRDIRDLDGPESDSIRVARMRDMASRVLVWDETVEWAHDRFLDTQPGTMTRGLFQSFEDGLLGKFVPAKEDVVVEVDNPLEKWGVPWQVYPKPEEEEVAEEAGDEPRQST